MGTTEWFGLGAQIGPRAEFGPTWGNRGNGAMWALGPNWAQARPFLGRALSGEGAEPRLSWDKASFSRAKPGLLGQGQVFLGQCQVFLGQGQVFLGQSQVFLGQRQVIFKNHSVVEPIPPFRQQNQIDTLIYHEAVSLKYELLAHY